MINRGILRRYVRALFELAIESRAHKKVRRDLAWFEEMLAENEDMSRYLSDPRVPVPKKHKTMEKMLPEELHELSRNFFLMTVERGRAELLPHVSEEYAELLREHEGVALAVVTTTRKLDPAQRGQLEKKLERVTGKSVKVEAHIDPEILGGMRIRIGSTMYDGSLRRRLEDVRHNLMAVSLPAPDGDGESGGEAPPE